MSLAELFTRGGPVMAVLAGFSVLATAIVFMKGVQFALVRTRRMQFDAVFGPAEQGRWDASLAAAKADGHPVARVLEAALVAGADARVGPRAAGAEVGRVGSEEIRQLESWLRALSAIAHLSPLVGLLGTVIGMIAAFMRIEDAGSMVDPAVLSGGIWQALLTTAFGLSIAIPATAMLHVFEGEVDRVRAAMRDGAVRILGALGKLDETELDTPAAGEDDYAV